MDPVKKIIETARNSKASKEERHTAFGQLVNQYYENATRWALARVSDPMLAQDAVQEGFVVAYQNLHTLKNPDAFSGWLRQIIFSQCTRLTRKKQLATKPIEQSGEIPTADSAPDKSIEEAELKERVLSAIEALPEKEQIVTQLFYLYGYSQKEIAKLLAIPVTTVKKRLQYARTNLRGILAYMAESFSPVEPQPQLEPIPIPIRRQPHPSERW